MTSDPLVLFPTAALIGAAISAPPGPAGAVCVARTLRSGVRSGLYCGLGVALGDVLYAFVAAYGVSVLDAVDPVVRRTCAGVAAAILCLAGARMLLSARRDARRAAPKSGASPAGTPRRDGDVEAHPDRAAERTATALDRVERAGDRPVALVATTFVLALATPGTLPALLALFATFHVGSADMGDVGRAVTIGSGVFAGGMAWWLVLVATAARFRGGAARALPVVNGIGGAALIAAAAVALHFAIAGS